MSFLHSFVINKNVNINFEIDQSIRGLRGSNSPMIGIYVNIYLRLIEHVINCGISRISHFVLPLHE